MRRSTAASGRAQPSRVTLGAAIRRAMDGSSLATQTVLADALEVDQRTVSRMIRGEQAVNVETVARIEHLCDLPAGQILVWAGYVTPAVKWSDDANVVALPAERRRPLAEAAEGGRTKRASRPQPRPGRAVGPADED